MRFKIGDKVIVRFPRPIEVGDLKWEGGHGIIESILDFEEYHYDYNVALNLDSLPEKGRDYFEEYGYDDIWFKDEELVPELCKKSKPIKSPKKGAAERSGTISW